MHRFFARGIVLTVLHARASAHALNVARFDNRAVAHAVSMLEFSVKYIAQNLHVTMTVRSKALIRGYLVLVDYPQRTKAHMCRIVVIAKRKAVEGLKPSVIGA